MYQRFRNSLEVRTSWSARWFTYRACPVRRPIGAKVNHGRTLPIIEPLDRRVMLAVSASFNAGTGVLTVAGDDQDNSIAIDFNAAGAIQVNAGAVAIQGGTPTAANTTLIQVSGQGGRDTMTFNGSDLAENFILSTIGSNHAVLSGDVANVPIDLIGVEQVDLNAAGGA